MRAIDWPSLIGRMFRLKNGVYQYKILDHGDIYVTIARVNGAQAIIPKRVMQDYVEIISEMDIDPSLKKTTEIKDIVTNNRSNQIWDNYSYGQHAISTHLAKFIIDNKAYIITNHTASSRKKSQFILQGPPGTGKSHHLDEIAPKDAKTTRVVGHPELTNSDFIGNYRPSTDSQGQTRYSFTPGPFTKLLASAFNKPTQDHILIIEELNRVNAAAMFAEVFQLLDRREDGWSQYPTDLGDDVLGYIKRELGEEHPKYTKAAEEGIQLPPNFMIWATMNTADQGVFPMDTAFKRRWTFEYLGVDENEEVWTQNEWNPLIPGYVNLRWQRLRQLINRALERAGYDEDRQLGGFFLTRAELNPANPERLLKTLMTKVVGYLRDDVVRYEPDALFVAQAADAHDQPRVIGLSGMLKRVLKQREPLLSLFDLSHSGISEEEDAFKPELLALEAYLARWEEVSAQMSDDEGQDEGQDEENDGPDTDQELDEESDQESESDAQESVDPQ